MSIFSSLAGIVGINSKSISVLGQVAKGYLSGGPGGAIQALGQQVTQPQRITTTTPLGGFSGSSLGSTVLRLIGQPTGSTPPLVGPGMPPPLPSIDSTKVSGVQLFPGGPVIGTTTTYSSPPAGGGPQPGSKGYHLNKTGYYTKGGYVAAGSRWVRNRRRNPLNPRALSRSISRISSAKNAAKFLGRVTVRDRANCN